MTKEEQFQNALNAYMNLDVHINKTLRLVGIDAIKKQIPTKVTKYFDGSCYCPICSERVDDDGRGYQQPYCMECGQKLDWSK